MLCVKVDLGQRSYPIYIGNNLLTNLDCYSHIQSSSKVMIVSNPTIAKLYLPTVESTLAKIGCQFQTVLIPDGEQYKDLNSFEQIITCLLEANYGRDCILLALGGGVIGDIVGYVAASYQRGVDFIQIPTTLLAQVDSSVGGKTGVNHKLGKNMIGAFYQPKAVIIDTNTLASLNQREFSSGLAEVIKYGAILDLEFFAWLEKNMPQLLALDSDKLAECIYHCCQIKANIVSADETEQQQRALLNFGHTFGHAIETHTNYTKWLHGEAVAIGMMIATIVSVKINNITELELARIKQLLIQANLPTATPIDMHSEEFFKYMQHDKKVLANKIRFILLKQLGNAYITVDVDHQHIVDAIENNHKLDN